MAIVAYAIFKENSHCKFEAKSFNSVDIKRKIVDNLIFYRKIMEQVNGNKLLDYYIDSIVKAV